MQSPETQIRLYYETLHAAWGPQHWWPANSAFEVIVGAYLTQNTSWTNVEIALRRMRRAHVLSLRGIRGISLQRLETLIRPAGYYRQKAARLKTLVAFLDQKYGGSLQKMFAQPTTLLREELLALNGVGPETADSILLYAGQHPVFVVDAYTRRILERHGLVAVQAKYDEVRHLCERALSSPPQPQFQKLETRNQAFAFAHAPSRMSRAKRSDLVQTFNDMHGLIVNVGKHYCFKTKPACERCPLRPYLPKSAP